MLASLPAAYTDELFGAMAYPIAGFAAAVVPEQTADIGHTEIVYLPLSDHPRGLVSSIVAVYRPRVDPAVTRLLDLVLSTQSGQ